MITAPPFQVSVLGPVRALRHGAPIALGAPKQRALLAALALHPGQPVAADLLVDLLWGDGAPATALATLQTYIAGLRRAIEPDRQRRTASAVLRTTSLGYVLDVPDEAIDAERFAASVERVHRVLAQAPVAVPGLPAHLDGARMAELRNDLDAALAGWGGLPYADLRDADQVVAARVGLEELQLVAVEDRARLRLACGEGAAVAAELGPLVREHRLRESLGALWALALAAAGRQADALDALHTIRQHLAEELGVDPGPAMQAVQAAILRGSPDLDRAVAPRLSVAERPTAPPAQQRTIAPVAPEQECGADGFPFIGRVDELAALDSLVAAAAGGRTTAAVVIGEAGVGKSRLLRETMGRAAARGFAVVAGRCSRDDGAPPLWPWARVLRDVSRAVPDLQPSPPELDSTDPAGRVADGYADSDAARFALWEAVTAALVSASRRQPLLIVLDDLHWADTSSLRLLRHVLESVEDQRIAVVATRRTLPEPTGALLEAGEALVRRGALRLHLAGLNAQEVRSLVTVGSGLDPGVQAAQALRERTDGNALFLTELVRAGAVASGEVPPGVADVVTARVAALPDRTRRALSVAAVIGRQFDTDLLAGVLGVTADEVLDALDPALAVGLVAEPEPELFRFGHALVRDAVYAGIPATRRARRHADVARAMSDRPGASSAVQARHWLAAGPSYARRAWQAAAAAARDATRVYAWEDAAGLLAAASAAQAADPEATGRERYDVLMAHADACRWSGDWLGLDAAVVAAVDVAEQLGDTRLAARAAVGTVHGAVWNTRPYGQVNRRLVAALRYALRTLPADDSPLRCHVMLALAVELTFADAPRERTALVEEGLAVARRLADPALLVWACTAAFLAIWRPDTAETRWQIAGEALTAAQHLGDPVQEVTARTLRAFGAQETGRIDEMWRELTVARDLANRLHLATHAVALGWLEIPWLALRGRFAEAESRTAETVALMRRTSMPQAAESPMGAMVVRMIVGTVDGDMVERMRVLTENSLLNVDSSLIALMVSAGRADEARAWYAQRGINLSHDDWSSLLPLCMAAKVAFELGERALAATVYRRLAPLAGRPCCAGGSTALGPVDAYLALAAAAAGDGEGAARHADDALALCDRWDIAMFAVWFAGYRERGGF